LTDSVTLTRPQASRFQLARTPTLQKLFTVAPVLAVLAVQAVSSLRLLASHGVDYGDETIYIYAGHQLIHELFHGGGSPYYETWFSGAPDLYPVLAGALDSAGGLTLAREFSLACMLGATVLLYLTAQRLFGYWTGLTAAGLFAALGITERLGVVATFDAPALLVLAAAAYAAVCGVVSTRWLPAVPLLLVLANAVKYATVIFDPVVIGLAALQLRELGWRRVAKRVAALGAATALLEALAVFLAGAAYWQGILFTTLAREGGAQVIFGVTTTTPESSIIAASWSWIGVVLVIGSLALLAAFLYRGERGNSWLLILLLLAGLLVTVEGLRLHTDQSIDKHDDFGIWFTCIAAGYAVARGAELVQRRLGRTLVVALALSAVALTEVYYLASPGQTVSPSQVQTLAASTQQYEFLAPLIQDDPSGRYLIGGLASYQTFYSDHLSTPWWQWADDLHIKYPIPGRGGDWHGQANGLSCGGAGQPLASNPGCVYLEGIPGYQAAIRAHAFALVSMVGSHGDYDQDAVILATVKSTPGYVQVSDQDNEPTFIDAADYPVQDRRPDRPAGDNTTR
jgi:Dolichyl-phosphate-mannose-protein mannosyltransferase